MSPLNKKLGRDLWRMKGQALAISAVIATGVLLLVMMSGIVTSLDQTRLAYYERNRLANVFAPVVRAPLHMLRNLAEVPGVSAVEGRVNGSALVDIKGLDLPIRAQALSVPDAGPPRLNLPDLTAGRWLARNRADEILLLNSFARAHGLEPGDTLSATMNGARRTFHIVGLVHSPEFLYTVAPGELVSDDSRFGALWMNETALAAAYDMKGAFNEALLTLSRSANETAVLNAVDRILEPYGSRGAYLVKDHTSNRFVMEEIYSMRSTSQTVPPLFMAVAAFLLYIVISRMVQAEREQIGLLKAFGYTSFEVALHYFKLILIISAGGAAMGCVLGTMAGRGMVDIYLEYYKFPLLVFRVEPASFLIGVLSSVLAASAGGFIVLRGVFTLTPAVAMRPPAPADYSRSGRIGASLSRLLDQPSRMVLRRLTRQPGRMLGSTLGIAAGMALAVAMISLFSSFEKTLDLTFNVLDRSDVTVTFTDPLSDTVIYELQRLPHVIEVEPTRSVSATLRNGVESYRGGVNGLVTQPRLNRAVDKNEDALTMPSDGIVLSKSLAGEIRAAVGDTIQVDVHEGRRPILSVPVVGITESLLGAPAYMELSALNEAMREPGRVSGAYLRIDAAEAGFVYRALKDMPSVAGVSLKEDARQAFIRVMNTGAGSMRFIMAAIAGVITFGIVYNAARIAQAERGRDLASLRVIGFTKGEASFVLLGELAVVTLMALPLGAVLGYFLTYGVAAGFSTDIYQIPVVFAPKSYGGAALAVLVAAAFSGWLVKRDVDRADIITALKTRE
ncbi:ABC transporter permease [Pseudovibrio exalbescens]|uniref:ABC transporter permease n=1 Tax=Pseudovibrio exalbescens TaxID=197461 RepID=UPI0023665D16|nr:ABC transporter permease [Pseudovibrio exalbescens]MDD7910980.1 ABC transporter permease [Pseudovibrio exalbescens]